MNLPFVKGIQAIGDVSPTPLTNIKTRRPVQKYGWQTGLTVAPQVAENLTVSGVLKFCVTLPGLNAAKTAIADKCQVYTQVEYKNLILVKKHGFSAEGDSGALVVTADSANCPQPLGIVIGHSKVNDWTYLMPWNPMISRLQAAYPTGPQGLVIDTSCHGPSQAQDALAAQVDSDMDAAESVMETFFNPDNLPNGAVSASVDMDVTPAAVDVQFTDQTKATAWCNFLHWLNGNPPVLNGGPIECSVEETIDVDNLVTF